VLLYNDAELGRRALFIHSTKTRIPLTWTFLADVLRQIPLVLVVGATYCLRRPFPSSERVRIGFFPTTPAPWYLIWNVYKQLGLSTADPAEECDVLYYFEDSAQGATDLAPYLERGLPVINARCADIGKDRVARVFEETFGYPLFIDPRVHTGPAVAKSVGNGRHDGRIVDCPIEAAEPGLVYQRLIRNSIDGRHAQDIRTPIIGGQIPFVYIKERPLEARFANDNSRCLFLETGEALSPEEVERVQAFVAAMRLDVGSLDILRDRETGRIYIVDVNKTCMGPPVILNLRDKFRAVHRMAGAFKAYIRTLKEGRGLRGEAV
jgi:hypothetical protein